MVPPSSSYPAYWQLEPQRRDRHDSSVGDRALNGPDPFFVGFRLLDPSYRIPGWSRLFGICRGVTRVVCQSPERVVIQDRRHRMTNTKTLVNRKKVNLADESTSESVNRHLQVGRRSQPVID